jgi:hypothetical protein
MKMQKTLTARRVNVLEFEFIDLRALRPNLGENTKRHESRSLLSELTSQNPIFFALWYRGCG